MFSHFKPHVVFMHQKTKDGMNILLFLIKIEDISFLQHPSTISTF